MASLCLTRARSTSQRSRLSARYSSTCLLILRLLESSSLAWLSSACNRPSILEQSTLRQGAFSGYSEVLTPSMSANFSACMMRSVIQIHSCFYGFTKSGYTSSIPISSTGRKMKSKRLSKETNNKGIEEMENECLFDVL